MPEAPRIRGKSNRKNHMKLVSFIANGSTRIGVIEGKLQGKFHVPTVFSIPAFEPERRGSNS